MVRVVTSVAAIWALLYVAVGGSTTHQTHQDGTTPRKLANPSSSGPSGGSSGSGTKFPPLGTFMAAARRDAQCKNCPYERCLNALVLTNGTDIEYSCYTLGESVNLDQIWLRHNYGGQLGDFCYVSPYDLHAAGIDYQQRLPFCGSKSALNFYLPSIPLRTGLNTECMLCPYRDCEGVAFYPPDVALEANCVLDDGWKQISVLQPNGTSTYFRTTDKNCFVSLATLDETLAGVAAPKSRRAAAQLPQCGPVPHLRLEERPPSALPRGDPGGDVAAAG